MVPTRISVPELSRGSYKECCTGTITWFLQSVLYWNYNVVSIQSVLYRNYLVFPTKFTVPELSRGLYKVYCNGTITWFLQSVLYRNYHVQGSYKYYCTGTITKFLQSVLPRNYHVVSTKCTVPELLVAEPTVAVLVLPGEGQLCQVLCTKL